MADAGSAGPATGRDRPVAVISVSIDLGAGRRGVDMGPSALRIAGVADAVRALGYRIRETGAVNASGAELVEVGEDRARYLDEVVRVCARTRMLVRQAVDEGCLPLILGGDHSLSMGSVPAMAAHVRERGEPLGLIWVDAHTDMNTPGTTPSGNIHGMSLAMLTGRGPGELLRIGGSVPVIDPGRVSVIGARQIDPGEREMVKEAGIRVFTISEVDERGMAACVDEAIERASTGSAGFHLSFDLDAVDPLVAPGVGTPVAGGISYREAHLLCEKAARSGRMAGLEVVELNPVLDEGNRSARLAVGLVESALGKAIL